MSALAIVPSAPVLIPEFAGAAATEITDLGAAVVVAAATLPPRWIVVGAGGAEGNWGPTTAGTFAGFGVDVPVGLSPCAPTLADLPLCALVAGWIRGQARPEASAQVRVYVGDQDPDTALARGRQLRAEIDQAPEPVGVLVVADGVNTLTPAAPGGYDPAGGDVQLALADALAGGDVAGLARLPARVLGRVAFQVLAGMAEPGPRSAKELYRGAPFGVGYFVGVWQL